MSPKKSKPLGGLWGMTKRALGAGGTDAPVVGNADVVTTSGASEPVQSSDDDAEFEDANEDAATMGDGFDQAGPVSESFESKKDGAAANDVTGEEKYESLGDTAGASTDAGAVFRKSAEPFAEPAATKSAKKRQRRSDAKAALRGMKNLIGDVKLGLAEKKQLQAEVEAKVPLETTAGTETTTTDDAGTKARSAPTTGSSAENPKLAPDPPDGERPIPDVFLGGAAAQRTWDTVMDTASSLAPVPAVSPSKSKSLEHQRSPVATPAMSPIKTKKTPAKTTPEKTTPVTKTQTTPSGTPAPGSSTPAPPGAASKKSLDPYATETERAAADALLAEGHRAFADARFADAARLYSGASAENGSGYAPLLSLRAHQGDASGALATLRDAAAVPGAAMHSAERTRDMAAALGRLFVAAASTRTGVSHESATARLLFPTPNGWSDLHSEPIPELAARRVIADARPALAAGLTLRGLDPKRFGNESRDGYYGAIAASAMSAAEALRVARPDTRGWRLAARLLAAAGRHLRDVDNAAARECLMACAGVVAGGIGTVVLDPLEAVAESEWTLAADDDDVAAEEARGVVVSAAAESCADRVVASIAARVWNDPESNASPSIKSAGVLSSPPQQLTSAIRSLVGCVSSTGASGAESAHGALYRAADAIWALKCLDAHDAKLEKVNRRIQNFDKDQCESDLGRAAVSLASAAAPSNGFGWDPIVVVGKCLASVNAIGSPAPELVDAMASLVPPGADQSLFALVTTLREKSLVAADKEKSKGTSGKELGNDGGAVLAAAERDRSRFIASVTEAVGKVACGGAVAAASAVASCPSVVFGDAIAHVAGRAARDSLAVGAESVPSTAAAKWWAANFHEAVLDPFDDALSADGVPGGRARDPLPRLLGLEPEPKRVPPRLDRVRLDQMTWATSPRAATPPNARAAVEARIAEANEAAIAGRECVFTTPKRVRAGVGATGVAPQTPLDHAAASIRKEAASLRVSLSSAVQADAAAAAACFETARARIVGMRVSNEPHDDDDDGSEKNSFVTCDFRSLGGARSFRASVGSAYHSVPNSPHGLNSVPTTPGWYAGGARGDDETSSRENDDDDDFFETTQERSAPATPTAALHSEFQSQPATPQSPGGAGSVLRALADRSPGAGSALRALADRNPFGARGSVVHFDALKDTVGGLLSRLSDETSDEASASSRDSVSDAGSPVDAFFAEFAEPADATRDVYIAHAHERDDDDDRVDEIHSDVEREGLVRQRAFVAIEAATRAASEASAAAAATAARNSRPSSQQARDAHDTAVARAVVRAAEASARARARSKRLASKAAQAVADACALDNLKTLRRVSKMTPTDFGSDPAPTTATSGRSGVRFAAFVAAHPTRAALIAASCVMTGMPPKMLSRVTPLCTKFERLAEHGSASHLRLLSRDAAREDAERTHARKSELYEQTVRSRGNGNEHETETELRSRNEIQGVSWVANAHTAFTAWAAANVLENASVASNARLTKALAQASEAQLRHLEKAARTALRGASGTSAASSPRSASSSGVSGKENEKATTARNVQKAPTTADFASQAASVVTTAATTRDPSFTVDAALAHHDPWSFAGGTSSSPIRDVEFLEIAQSAAVEAARLGPSAREMYYASYQAAMESAAVSLGRHNASAVMAAAAGAVRCVRGDVGRASLRATDTLLSYEGPLKTNQAFSSPARSTNLSARRKADAALARRRASGASPLLKGVAGSSHDVRLSTREAYACGFGAATTGDAPRKPTRFDSGDLVDEILAFASPDTGAGGTAIPTTDGTAEACANAASGSTGASVVAPCSHTPSPPPDPFPSLIAATQALGGRAFAKLWLAETKRLHGRDEPFELSTMTRREATVFATTELLADDAKNNKVTVAYLSAQLAVDAPDENDAFTLTSFTRAARDSARATAAAALGEGRHSALEGVDIGDDKQTSPPGPDGTTSEEKEKSKKSRLRKGGGGGVSVGAAFRSHELAVARIAELVDAAVGTLKRRFTKDAAVYSGKNAPGSISPVSLTRALVDVSVTPSDTRAALAELWAWEGFPLDVRFHLFRQTLRPRSVRITERRLREKAGLNDLSMTEEAAGAEDVKVVSPVPTPIKNAFPVPTPSSDEQYGLGFDIGTVPLDSNSERDTETRFSLVSNVNRVSFASGSRLARNSPSKSFGTSSSPPGTPITPTTTQTIRTLGFGVRSSGKNQTPKSSGSKLGAARDLKLASQTPSSPFSVAGERAARRAEAELQLALSVAPPARLFEEGGVGGWWTSNVTSGEREESSRSPTGEQKEKNLNASKGIRSAPGSPLRADHADATRRADHAERARNTAVREATEGFIRVNESYRVLEENAEAFEVDLLRSAQVMRAMDTARAEREDSATASLLRRAREKRLEAEAEERAFEAARRVVRRGGKK